jgi:hypothetical protein
LGAGPVDNVNGGTWRGGENGGYAEQQLNKPALRRQLRDQLAAMPDGRPTPQERVGV